MPRSHLECLPRGPCDELRQGVGSPPSRRPNSIAGEKDDPRRGSTGTRSSVQPLNFPTLRQSPSGTVVTYQRVRDKVLDLDAKLATEIVDCVTTARLKAPLQGQMAVQQLPNLPMWFDGSATRSASLPRLYIRGTLPVGNAIKSLRSRVYHRDRQWT